MERSFEERSARPNIVEGGEASVGGKANIPSRGFDSQFSGFNAQAEDLGHVAADQSINWLQAYIYPAGDLSTEAITLIALHAGDLPVDILERLLAVTD